MDEYVNSEIELDILTTTEVVFDESGSEVVTESEAASESETVTESEVASESEAVTESESVTETEFATETEAATERDPDQPDQEPTTEIILDNFSIDGAGPDAQLLSSTGSGASSSAALEEKIDHISATLDLISVVLVFWIGYFILGSFRSWLIKGGRSNWNH